jgi:hypothetical protein
MIRPSSAPPRRARVAVLLGAATTVLLLAGCPSTDEQLCPGAPVGTFDLQGVRRDGPETSCVGEPPDGWVIVGSVPPRIPYDPDHPDDTSGSVTATLSGDLGSGTTALCTGARLGDDLTGTRTGDHIEVSATTEGALLGGCAATCAATLTVTVEGELVPPATPDAPLRFEGTLIEQLDSTGADCGQCVLPCKATYDLTGDAR